MPVDARGLFRSNRRPRDDCDRRLIPHICQRRACQRVGDGSAQIARSLHCWRARRISDRLPWIFRCRPFLAELLLRPDRSWKECLAGPARGEHRPLHCRRDICLWPYQASLASIRTGWANRRVSAAGTQRHILALPPWLLGRQGDVGRHLDAPHYREVEVNKAGEQKQETTMKTRRTQKLMAAALVGALAFTMAATTLPAQESHYAKLANAPFPDGYPAKESVQPLK